MQYQTIVLELLQQRTQWYEQLRRSRTLLPALRSYARQFMESHEAWMETLRQADPDRDPIQIRSEAMEQALKELEDRLPSDSPQGEREAFSLDQAIAFVLSPTPRG